jgi:serine/threonine protein kinase/Tfp pilus assembly protein PilF
MRDFYGVQKGACASDSTMIRVIRICRKCGAKIFSDVPEGLCPRCVLKSALGNFSHAPVAAGADGGSAENVETNAAAAAHDAKKSARAAELLGELGDYELLEEVGRGGQGVVFRARQKSLNRTVALKVISLGQWASKAHLKRFRLEAEAAARLEHPGIVPIHEVGERDGSCYFSMKFVEGGQLDEVARRKPTSIRQAVELIAKVARTVHYAHEHGILHRDIKPGNILLDQKGEPHLTDFGLARLVESESSVTHTLDVLGTPSYMAPEQAVGNNAAVSSATDVYGLGAVLYQLLTGQPPFAGGATYETIKLLLDTEPKQPRLLNPKIDRDLSTICLKCLEKDPKRRYPSALALAEDLERWLKHEPIQARSTGIFARGTKWVRRNPTSALLAASLVALVAAAGWIVWKSEFIRHPVANGIAVLPFENFSPDPDNAYFADGIQDEILTRLAKIADLKVISRTSTQQYQSKPRNLAQIAKQLGVANILEGSVQKSADQVRINVQLINAQTDFHLWAETYDRKLTDIFGVESEIAKGIAKTLRVRLPEAERQQLTKRPTENLKAFQYYLQGRSYRHRNTREDLLTATRYFERALEEDRNYSLAYAGLADAYGTLGLYGYIAPIEGRRKEEEAARKALALDENLAEAHAALGQAYVLFAPCYFSLGDSALRRAIELSPSLAIAHSYLGVSLARQGRLDESVAENLKAREFDPLSSIIARTMALPYHLKRDYARALDLLRQANELGPSFITTWEIGIYIQNGLFNETLVELEKAKTERKNDSILIYDTGMVYAAQGKRTGALQIIKELEEMSGANLSQAHWIAKIYASLNEKELAFSWLERGLATGAIAVFYKDEPVWDPIRSDPRFEALVEKTFVPTKTPGDAR